MNKNNQEHDLGNLIDSSLSSSIDNSSETSNNAVVKDDHNLQKVSKSEAFRDFVSKNRGRKMSVSDSIQINLKRLNLID